MFRDGGKAPQYRKNIDIPKKVQQQATKMARGLEYRHIKSVLKKLAHSAWKRGGSEET